MGYCMDQGPTLFKMDKKNVPAAYKAVMDLTRKKDYSWVAKSRALDSDTLGEIMDEWRWEICQDDATWNVDGICFMGEKLGDDDLLFKAIAPYVEPGSYIQMRGEDGAIWRWEFDGKDCIERTGRVVFD